MADEAFALSPISARAAQPSEEDYAAISEAFMETSRGRWFLGEYAKRNRNADTRLVLDAVARIEESIAAQKQAAADETLAEALAAIRAAVGEAQASATSALEGLGLEQHLAPVRKGARVMREISWRLREIGNDGRICDILDAQAAVIEAAAGQVSTSPARDAQDAAFAAIEACIAKFSVGAAGPEARQGAREDANVVPFPAPAEDVAAAVVAPIVAAEPVAAIADEIVETPAEPPVAEPTAAFVEPEVVVSEEAANAHDEAMLDLIAAEMSAPQPIDDIDDLEMTMPEPPVAEAAPPIVETAAQQLAEQVIAQSVATQAQTTIEPVAEAPAPEPAAEDSLGSTILASGILKKPARSLNDPLAPIRRMSQAERIAFFS
jgi:hypothetical protein